MKTLALLQLCLSAAAALLSHGSTGARQLTAAQGGSVLLPCYAGGDVTPTLSVWMKNGVEMIRGGGSSPNPSPSEQRVEVLQDGSLSLKGVVPGDEGSYLCDSTLPGNDTFQARVLLRVTSGPNDVSTSIGPATALPNGTLFTFRGSTILLNCSSSSYPSQQLTWAFSGGLASSESLVSTSGSWLDFQIKDIQPSAQGVYSCRAHNTVSQQAVDKSTELLVYYAPDRRPMCMWEPTLDPSNFQFICTWFGAYPTPTLRWGEDQGGQGAGGEGHDYATNVTDSLIVTLNRSMLSEGQTLRCMAQHQALAPGKDNSCSFTFKPPYPEGEPMATAQTGTSITLTCTEASSDPPANTTWRKGLRQEHIAPGSKYVFSEEGPVLKLTIFNISKDDEGIYFCRSENPLAVCELEVYLTVTNSSAYTGAIIGVFIAALIVGLAAIIAKTVYSSRHQICLGGGFGVENNGGDVMSLVESDDEQIFQDAVPRLPPLTNGNLTTLVQIHPIPPSDCEESEAEIADTSPEQQEKTVQTEESVDLVTF